MAGRGGAVGKLASLLLKYLLAWFAGVLPGCCEAQQGSVRLPAGTGFLTSTSLAQGVRAALLRHCCLFSLQK